MFRRIALFVLVLALVAGSGVAQEAPTPDSEAFGRLKLEQPSMAVVSALGQPAKRGKAVRWEAIGEWVQTWSYPSQGLELALSSGSRKGSQKLFSITAKSPCKLATARGIKLGSSEAEVRAAYGAVEEKEQGAPGKTFVAGTVYGGIIFTFAGGRVSEIFVGAAAE